MSTNIQRTDDEWRQVLTPEQFEVLRRGGTERAFTGAYWDSHEQGVYRCGACNAELFRSDDKFDSGTGWPSFTRPVESANVELHDDNSFFMRRTEVRCASCGSHLGHVFDDGPPTEGGKRFCINSCALSMEPHEE
ncbi:MAG TPA: peptide-methionine (R)-S-oxide reductase MsrB [Gaiellales bacterium]|jgi:peptide-methionine (R)-S-oxide reductase|nr:peptide-methionine (R)-S-oxide reductase MsrB [Gaiellales bacterium]